MSNLYRLLLAFVIFFPTLATSQIESPLPPQSDLNELSSPVPVEWMPSLNMALIREENRLRESVGELPEIGKIHSTQINLNTHGHWTNLPDGGRVWRLKIRSGNALAISLYYNSFYLPPGATLHIYNEDRTSMIGAFTQLNNPKAGFFATGLINGETSILEYFEPEEAIGQGRISISGVGHAYRHVKPQPDQPARDFDDSDPCQVNVNCSEGDDWQDEKRGVARILLKIGNSFFWCSGSLVNNAEQDCSPFFLTAWHCGQGASTADLNQWIFYFNYESANCANPAVEPGSQTITGASLLAHSNDGGGNTGSDFLLVELNNNVPQSYNVYYNGWSNLNQTSSSGVGIHHPSGDIKKISTYTSNLNSTSWGGTVANTHWRVFWSSTTNGHGVTEGGSSGSPIFNSAGLIIGKLTGGASFCTSPNAPDFYGKFSYSWASNGNTPNRRLRDWLDPNNTGVTELGGTYFPCSPTCDLTLDLTDFEDVGCNGGSNGEATADVDNGLAPYTFLWSDMSTDQTAVDLSPGTYQVTVTDVTGCEITGSVTIGEPAALTANATATGVSCQGDSDGSIDLTVMGGVEPYTFIWNNGAGFMEDPDNLGPGSYSVNILDANGCLISSGATVTEPDPITGTTSVTDVSAPGAMDGAIDLTVTGGTPPYFFLWNNGAGTDEDPSGLGPGTYAVNIFDANGCTGMTSATVAEPQPLSASAVATDVSCNGANDGSIDLTVSGGTPPYFFLWNNGAGTDEDPSELGPGTYAVNVFDNTGASTSTSATIAQPDPITGTTSVTDVSAPGAMDGAIDLTVSGGTPPYFFLWNNGAGTDEDPSGLGPGTYAVNIFDANGCTGMTSATVAEPQPLSASAVATDVSCNGANDGSIDLTVSGGTPPYFFLWNNGAGTDEDPSGLGPGTYAVNVFDNTGASTSISATIAQPDLLTASTSVTDVSCNGDVDGAIDLTVFGGTAPYTYLWNNGAGFDEDPTGLGPGNYSVNIIDANGCIAFSGGNVGQPALIDLTAVIDGETGVGNGDGAIDLNVSGGTLPYTYLWSNMATSEDLTGLSEGTYGVTVTDQNGCQAFNSYDVGLIESAITLCPTVLLGGSFNPSALTTSELMRTQLRDLDLIPLSHNYNIFPWEYEGAEAFPELGSMPLDMVDWILIRIRDGLDPAVILTEFAAVLHSDGSVTDTDGALPSFEAAAENGFYLEIVHRSHLPISSAVPLFPDMNNTVCYDFTIGQEMAYRNIGQNDDPQAELTISLGTFYSLVASNVQSNDCQVDFNDLNLLFLMYNAGPYYGPEDVNMDGVVDANDINFLFGSYDANCHSPY